MHNGTSTAAYARQQETEKFMTNNGQAASEGYAGSMHPRADLWRSLGARTYGFIAPILANSAWQRGGMLFRRIAGGVIGILGIYFILQPFVTTA